MSVSSLPPDFSLTPPPPVRSRGLATLRRWVLADRMVQKIVETFDCKIVFVKAHVASAGGRVEAPPNNKVLDGKKT
jgi:hypothetical protein